MALTELNDRWRRADQPHGLSVAEKDRFRVYCPRCQYKGCVSLPLFVAMNDALVHKQTCDPDLRAKIAAAAAHAVD
jgi:hypothetical protein